MNFLISDVSAAEPHVVPAGGDAAAPGAVQATTATTQAPASGLSGLLTPNSQQPGIMGMLLPFAVMFGVLYFLMIRPQQKKQKEQQAMLSAVKAGDDVVTSAGLLGRISGVNEKVVTLEVADGVKIKVLKSQIAQVIKGSVKDLVL